MSNISDGTEQSERFSPLLRDGYFNVDEMSFEDLLALSAKLSSRLHYYNLEFCQDGTWSELFLSDETAIMSLIITKDLHKEESHFQRLLQISSEIDLAQQACRLAEVLNDWLKRLEAIEGPSAQVLAWHMTTMIDNKLASELHSLGAWMQNWLAGKQNTAFDFGNFEGVWKIRFSKGVPQFPNSRLVAFCSQQECRDWLRSVFYSFLNAVHYLKKLMREYVSESLQSKTHNPATALFMSFLILYGKVQAHLNTFTQRHLDFYYLDYLKLTPRQEIKDFVHLSFNCNIVKNGIFIAKGTGFTAGKDSSGSDIIYNVDTDLLVTDARIEDVRTLYFERDPLISPERELNYTTRVRTHQLPFEKWNDPEKETGSWSIFGCTDAESQKLETSKGTELGFAISSPVLLLKEGRRTVEISILFNQFQNADKTGILSELCEAVIAKDRFFFLFGILFRHYILSASDLLSNTEKEVLLRVAKENLSDVSSGPIEQIIKQDRDDLFYSLFSKIFTLSLTGEAGWHEVTDLVVSRYDDGKAKLRSGLKFLFNLGPDAPPIVPFDQEVHRGSFEAGVPVVRFFVNSHADFFPYSIFTDICIREVNIDVSAKGISNILAHNNHGQLDPSKPFNPFGPLPSCNSYFVFGNFEVSKKKLTSLSMDIEWGGLPRESGGFESYYAAYNGAYTNEAFRAEVSVLRDAQWHPDRLDAPVKTALFETVRPGGSVNFQRTLTLDVLNYYKPSSHRLTEDSFHFDLRARNGFFKFTLCNPEAFGHRDYSTLLTAALSANAKTKRKSQQLPIPNVPYTPLINRISLDYRATSVIKAGLDISVGKSEHADRLYHIHSFGIETVYPVGNKKNIHLLPQFSHDGNLMIGFSASVSGGVLTFFFHLKEDSTHEISSAGQKIDWFYLAGDQWHFLTEAQILADTTKGFITSGIVTLDIPKTITNDNNVMPSGLFWIRASAQQRLNSYCSLHSIQLHAVRATRLSNGWHDGNAKALPAWSVKGPVVSISGLDSALQTAPSFSGKPPETAIQLKTRASERLRHKNRAVTAWDFERIVLEQFPSVFKVKCFPAMTSDDQHKSKPGHVLVVVVPYQTDTATAHNDRPMLNANELDQIHSFLRAHASPFVTIEVRNPAYEVIQVRCTVKLAAWAQSHQGMYINRLNNIICNFLSPWKDDGYKARFGWCIRRSEIEAHILEQDFVDFVTRFSMFQISEQEYYYTLEDTAARPIEEDHDNFIHEQLYPNYPWSIAVPMPNHYISSMSEMRPIAAEITGINELQVGTTFIMGA
jgi:hypothetical protein